MTWFASWPESIKKRACRYLLQHYVGQYLQEKLRLDQLSVDLYNGTGYVNDVALDIWALNSMLDQAHVPMELVDGFIGSIEVSIPWTALLNDNCTVEIKGLEITLQPKYRTDEEFGSMTDSFYRSLGNMTTSMELAQECLKEEASETKDTTAGGLFEGLEVFAQTIESVLSRVKVSLTDMVIRIEHLPENAKKGIAVEIHIDRIDYFDEITMDEGNANDNSTTAENPQSNNSRDKKTVFQRDSVTCKHFRATGLKILLDEFPEHLRTTPPGSTGSPGPQGTSPINISGSPEFETMTHTEQTFQKCKDNSENQGPLLIGKFFEKQELKLRIRQSEHVTVPKLDAECYLGTCSIFLTPNQVHLLTEFASGLVSPSVISHNISRDCMVPMQTNNFATCTEGIRLSPNVGSLQSNAGEEVRRNIRKTSEDLNMAQHPYPDLDDGEQFFSMEASKLYSRPQQEPSEYDDNSEYGTSIYSQSTAYTPSSAYTNHLSKVSRMHPSTKLMGARQHFYGNEQSELKYQNLGKCLPGQIRHQLSNRVEDEKNSASHCHYQFQIRAIALTILHINPLPASASPTHSHKSSESSLITVTPHPSIGSNVDNGDDNNETSNCYIEMSEKYFGACENILDEILKFDKTISSARNELAAVSCSHDHLRFVATHVYLNSEQKTPQTSSTELSFGRAELTECVFTDPPQKPRASHKGSKKMTSPKLQKKCPIHSELLVFDSKSNMSNINSPSTSPNIRLHLSSHDSHRDTKTSLLIHLSACESEVDISIVDRLNTLLHLPDPEIKMSSTTASLFSPHSYSHSHPDAFNKQAAFNEVLAEDNKDRQVNCDISASSLKINFRFPIADLRPEMERRPWYARSLRDEILTLEANEIAFHSSSIGSTSQSSTRSGKNWHLSNSNNQHSQEFEINVKDLHILYSDEPGKPKSFLRISQSPADMEPLGGPVDANSDFDCPHIKVTINPSQEKTSELLMQANESMPEQSSSKSQRRFSGNADTWFDEDFLMSGSQDDTNDVNPSPFSSRKVMYNSEELILPGEPSEIAAFSDHAVSSSLICISIHLPAVNAFLISKSFFENLYNRINNDILLWAPAAPKPHGKSKGWFDNRSVSYLSENNLRVPDMGLDIASQLLGETADEEDISDSYDSDDASTNYSRPSLLGTSRQVVKSYDNGKSVGKQSLISISTKIGYGRITAKCNTLCSDSTVSNSEHGEVVIMLENVNIFNVAGYCGNPLLDYVCVQIANASLYHKSCIPSLSSTPVHVERLNAERPEHLDEIITKCEDGISRTFKSGNETQNMLVLAIKIQTEEARAMKRCLIAAGVSDVTLHHRFSQPCQSWLEQIIDFVDATDDKVLGYKPPSFITQIHLNVKNSAAVYTPIHMSPPISAVIAATSFSLSSNLVAGAEMSILNIIIDEAKLYITDQQDDSYIDITMDYACILYVNFLELCLKLSNNMPNQDCSESDISKYPLIDFQASNNMIKLHTCADSCAALGALVRYLADDGDLSGGMLDDDSVSDYQSQIDGRWTEKDIVPEIPASDVDSSESEDDGVADLMADAMEEVFEDARSDFEKPKKSAMAESMYAFSTSSNDRKLTHCHKPKDVMSQSVMMPNDLYRNKSTKSVPRLGKDVRYTPLRKHGIRHQSESPDDDEFCIIDDELGTSNHSCEPEITYRWEEDDNAEENHIYTVENHFEPTRGKIDQLQPPEHFPTPVARYTLKELSCIWYMYGGSDFKTTDPPSRRNSGVKARDVPPHSPKYKQSSPIQLKYNARQRKVHIGKQESSRDSTMLMEVHLTKVRCRFEQYPDDTFEASRSVVIVSDFEIRDKLQASRINKFLYRFHSESSPRQAHAKALSLKVLQIRPEGVGTPTESKLRISLQPLRLNVEQDTLNFLTKFFADLSASSNEVNGSPSHWIAPMSEYKTAVGSPSSPQNHSSPNPHVTPYSSPVMTRPKSQNLVSSQTSKPPSVLENEDASPSGRSGASSNKTAVNAPTMQPTFFREVIFSPEVPIRLDYHGKRIDTEQGTISGLLMGLGQLNCSQLKLKRIVNKHGLLGIDKLVTFLLNEWAADIRANQLPLILGGVGPMHSVVQLFKGFRDLVYLPVEQYRKDGRLVRGFQRGATSFGTSTAIAALEITNRAIGLIQSAAETTYELVSPHELHRREVHAQRNWRTLGNHAIRRQPADIREGMSNALTVMKHGVEDTVEGIVRVAKKEHERKGVTAAAGGVLRHIPPAFVQPLIMVAEATTNVLSGIRNQIQPDAKQQDEDKWKNMTEEELS